MRKAQQPNWRLNSRDLKTIITYVDKIFDKISLLFAYSLFELVVANISKLMLDCARTGNQSNNPKLNIQKQAGNAVRKKASRLVMGKQLDRGLFLQGLTLDRIIPGKARITN